MIKARLKDWLEDPTGFGAFQNVIAQLVQLSDDCFVCDFCLDFMASTQNETHQLLAYAKSRVTAKTPKAGVAAVLEAIRRLGTFMMLDIAFNASEWHRFRRASMVDNAIELLTNSKFQQVVILWRRHQSGTLLEFIFLKLFRLWASSKHPGAVECRTTECRGRCVTRMAARRRVAQCQVCGRSVRH